MVQQVNQNPSILQDPLATLRQNTLQKAETRPAERTQENRAAEQENAQRVQVEQERRQAAQERGTTSSLLGRNVDVRA